MPKEKNEVLALLMDAGKLLFGRLEGKNWVGGWLKLDIRLFLREFRRERSFNLRDDQFRGCSLLKKI